MGLYFLESVWIPHLGGTCLGVSEDMWKDTSSKELGHGPGVDGAVVGGCEMSLPPCSVHTGGKP